MEDNELNARLTRKHMEQSAAMRESEIDWRVIQACREGDRAAFQLLFEAYKDRVYSIALHFTANESAALDVSQQVFLKLFTAIKGFREDSQLTTWLYRIVANACMDERRSRKRFIPLEQEGHPRMVARGLQEDNFRRNQLAASVRSAISGLSPKLRLPVLLKYIEGLSYEEIAESLGVSMGTVASRLNRGHKILAQKLAHLRGELGSGGL